MSHQSSVSNDPADEDLRKRFLKLLDEDEEFRQLVIAKLGLKELLDALARLEERFVQLHEEIKEILNRLDEHDRKFNEILQELREHGRRLDHHDQLLETLIQKTSHHDQLLETLIQRADEHDRKFNEILQELREHGRRLDHHDQLLETLIQRADEHDRKFNEILQELREHGRRLDHHDQRLEKVEAQLATLTNSFQKLTLSLEDESMDVVYHRLKDQTGIKIEPSILDLTPDMEIDLYGTDNGTCLIGETSIRVGPSLVEEVLIKLDKLKRLHPEYLKNQVILVVYGLRFTEGAIELAREKGVWLVTANKDFTPIVIHDLEDLT